MKTFCNSVTRAVFTEVLAEWARDGIATVAQQWHDIAQGSAAECLAEQLQRDLYLRFRDCGDDVLSMLARAGLRLIAFRQIADALLTCAKELTDDKPESGDKPDLGAPPAEMA